MESLNNSKAAKDTKSAGKPKMKDNNDDNEFATPGLKASFSVESKKNDQDNKASAAVTDTPAGGSSDKADTEGAATASMIEQKLNARMEDLVMLVEKAGTKIQRIGEALCRLGDQVEHLPERKFGMKKNKSNSNNAQSSNSSLN